ncbi:MAG: bifunctional phosphoribosylaminoimidazolecarboxamide formyltransferase/IMP cyclohydrolase, partial [Candidatus Hydrogenedentota bacterium]
MTLAPSALLSLTDKTGVDLFASELSHRGIGLIATGGTAALLQKNGLTVREAGELTGVGEIMDGRVKTLSPMIFAGILARRHEDSDIADLTKLGAPDIRLVVCNLYQFDPKAEDPVPGIDIGGVALIRAAAKNCRDVAVLVDPADYSEYLATFDRGPDALAERRIAWAAKAWDYIADYDAAIAEAYAPHRGDDRKLRISLSRHRELRYGENPHQSATWWRTPGAGLHDAETVEGKELSYNNILDISAATALAQDLGEGAAAIIKHQNPCGAARRGSSSASLAAALETDRAAAFGGVIAVNGEVDIETVSVLDKLFFEVIIAPVFSGDALERLKKKKNLRIVKWPRPVFGEMEFRTAPGGLLTQSRDAIFLPAGQVAPKVVSKRAPTD